MPSLQELYAAFEVNKLSSEEERAFLAQLSLPAHEAEAREIIRRMAEQVTETPVLTAEQLTVLHKSIIAAVPPSQPVRRVFHWTWAAAVVFLMVCSALVKYTFFNQPKAYPSGVASIQPGKSGAILVLGDGTKVLLDTVANGVVANQSGTQVQLQNGQLLYGAGDASATITYNTMYTPRGRQFKLMLPDGSLVWLNAASSIRYPTKFGHGQRLVELSGEAYFEVAGSPGHPFVVNVANQAAVEVLGTHFNVQAYDNENEISTTLLEGKVRIKAISTNQQAILLPGQQARISQSSAISLESAVDIDKVIAWKEGQFNFEDTRLEEIMHQLERWYDIETIYEDDVRNIRFGSIISRKEHVQSVLTLLELTGEVSFRTSGRLIYIRKGKK
ncbi:FecR family protein [Chitinophaga sp. sic0106]|uniref:FecR family protein n=1 Tax=Chitinophaga sp. sic0106 TaxID=2854785 RepID=UPI001C4715A6|nr:FecR family protein [Chitinophaga sp. sic0106]MBV7533261.1 FecR domain-containing protein [Chitinophaga sp. sic0106]